MKSFNLIIILVVLFFNESLNAQTILESDYVYKGETIQYITPKGFKNVIYEDEPFAEIYLLDTNGFHEAAMDYFLDTVPFDKGIVHGSIEKEENLNDLEFIVYNLQSIIDEEFGELILFREAPKYSVKNGVPFATVKCKYPDSEFDINEFKICVIEFGDFFFYFATFHAKQSDNKLMEYLFNEVMSSIKVIPTTKENTLLTWESVQRIYQNSGVNTNIETGKINFEKESSTYWESWGDEEFLLHYDYGAPDAQIQGSVRILSAGVESAEMTDEELKDFFSESELSYSIDNVTLIVDVKGVSKEFKKYSISGSKDVLQLYTTKLDGELLLIFAIQTTYSNDFKKYYERFVKSMYISE